METVISCEAKNDKQIAIIGAGISGLLACKYVMEKGFEPVVFEARPCIGGVWSSAIESTKLQCAKHLFQFTDFPWPESVSDTFADHHQVMEYIRSYAQHFDIVPRIRFNQKVISIEHLTSDDDDMSSWTLWGGNGQAFSPKGKWNVTVEDVLNPSDGFKVYQVDFVILCIGLFSDLPYIPDFPTSKEGFKGKVVHSMDYAALDKMEAINFTAGKKITVVGSRKSAVDIAEEVAKNNGPSHPCTLVFRRVQWPGTEFVVNVIFRNLTRFCELMIHKPNEGLIFCFLATLLSPLREIFSKLVELYVRCIYPLKKYNMIPDHTFLRQIYSCMFTILPNKFFDRVREGSLVLKKSSTLSFCENGLILENETDPLETDIVILATGYKSDEKLSNIFSSIEFKKYIIASSAPFYRQCIHPRIPNLAIMGFVENPATIFFFELRTKWLAHFLDGKFSFPSIKDMEDNVAKWEQNGRFYSDNYRRSCVGVILQIHCNDLLYKDMGINHRRKKWFLPELLSPYSPKDYADS